VVEEVGQIELRREDLRELVGITARLEGRDLGGAMAEILFSLIATPTVHYLMLRLRNKP
jgi:hypothetical protein